MGTNDSRDDIEAILGIKIEFYDPDDITQLEELALELPIGGS